MHAFVLNFKHGGRGVSVSVLTCKVSSLMRAHNHQNILSISPSLRCALFLIKKKDSRASVGPHPALKVHLIFSIPLPRAARKNDTKIHWGHSKTSVAWDAPCRMKWDEGPLRKRYTQAESEDWPFCLINEIDSALGLFAETNDYYEILNSQGMPLVHAKGGWNCCSALWWIWNRFFFFLFLKKTMVPTKVISKHW